MDKAIEFALYALGTLLLFPILYLIGLAAFAAGALAVEKITEWLN